MILTCPSCTTRYLINPAALGESGRTVRCARCAHSWIERPPDEPLPPPPIDIEPPPEAVRPIPQGSNLPALHEARPSRAWIGWTAMALLVIALLGGGVVARDRVIEAWLPAARLYSLIGLAEPEPDEVFELRNVRQSTYVEEGRTVVVVTGEIVNVSKHKRLTPKVFARIQDKDQQVLTEWAFEAASVELESGEATAFSDRFSDLPKGAVNLIVSLQEGS